MSSTVCLYPSDFYELMEQQREKLSGIILRENYVPIFIVESLQAQLSSTDYQKGQNSIITWNRDSLLTDNPDLESRFLIPNVEIKSYIKRLLVFASLVKKAPGIGFNQHELNDLFYKKIKCPSLELIWLITCSKYKLFSFTSYIVHFQTAQYDRELFTKQMVDFCFSSCLFEETMKRKCTKILQDFLPEILIASYSNPESNKSLISLKRLTDEIVKKITRSLLSSETMVCSFMTRQLLLAILEGVVLPNSIKQKYFTQQLDDILSQESELSPHDVLRQQEKFAGPVEIENSAKWETISLFIREPLLTKAEILDMLQRHIRSRSHNLNWESLLLIITIWTRNEDSYSSSLFRLLKKTIRSLMTSGLSEKREVDVLAAFILARHSCLVSPQNFGRYEKWYTGIFGNEATSPARTLETFTYLASLLSSWIPDEPVCFLQVHATYWPHIPTGMRLVWIEYVNISKTRISEYYEVEQAMDYEPNPNNPIQYHIEMILKSFDSLKKIPEVISEMLMFRKSYYYEQFLPLLLRKSHGVPFSDVKVRLIEALNATGKIPKNLYTAYKQKPK